ncbi:MAG: EAL domain-containing protein [Proteobacteria bacterium]|nr:EAL domain-containing protein [Pseudomonadota bacterium]
MRSVSELMEAGLVYVAFQPLIDLAERTTFGYESLARSGSTDYRNPLHLLKAAKEHSVLGELGRELRRLSVDGCPDYPLFLNIHPDEFDEGWLVRPDDPLSQHDKGIFLEITESVPLSHYRFCHSVLKEIRGKGIKIAVDDLGAGYSNLKYIADLEPEVVKLDRELVAGLTTGSRLFELVKSIVALCRVQGAKVVAEGIETASELRAVLATGAHYGQGYYFARPSREPTNEDWTRWFDRL